MPSYTQHMKKYDADKSLVCRYHDRPGIYQYVLVHIMDTCISRYEQGHTSIYEYITVYIFISICIPRVYTSIYHYAAVYTVMYLLMSVYPGTSPYMRV